MLLLLLSLQLFKAPDFNSKPFPTGIKEKRARAKSPCTTHEIFNFGWSIFLLAKAHYPSIADNLVFSHFLLLTILEFLFSNTISCNRQELINASFPGFGSNSINELCFQANPVILYLINNDMDILKGCEGIATHYWLPFLSQLKARGILQEHKPFIPGDIPSSPGLFSLMVFSMNLRNVVSSYEMFVLNENELDERIFLRDSCSNEIGAFKQKMEDLTLQENSPETQNGVPLSKLRPPMTPLTS